METYEIAEDKFFYCPLLKIDITDGYCVEISLLRGGGLNKNNFVDSLSYKDIVFRILEEQDENKTHRICHECTMAKYKNSDVKVKYFPV